MTKKPAKKAAKAKAKSKKKKNPGVRKGDKVLYGAAAKAVLKQRAQKARKNAAKKRPTAAKPNPKPKTKPAKKSAKRNAADYSASTPIAVTKHFRAGGPGYATQRERTIRAGQRDLFAQGASADELLGYLRRNPTILDSAKRKYGAQAVQQAGNARLRQMLSTVIREAHGKAKPAKKAAPKKRTRRNPDTTPPGAVFEMFTGQPYTHADAVNVADGESRNFDVCGELEEFVWIDRNGDRHKVNLWKAGQRALLGNKRGKDGYDHLLLASHPETPDELPRFSLPEGDHGWIAQVTYWAQKVHLGDTKPRPYYHDLGTSPVAGEGTGVMPVMHINHEGALIFKGGEYWIEDRGIVN